jgi:alkylation response protein AidB-like acyl-CoA dehydrogenase
MDARLTEEQRSLRETAGRIARRSAAATVDALGDSQRITQLARDLADSGLLELRHADAGPTGVEVAIVAEQLAAAASEASFVGPTLAADLCRRAGIETPETCTIALTTDLDRIAVESDLETALAFDAGTVTHAFYLTESGDKYGLAVAPLRVGKATVDLTRPLAALTAAETRELAGPVLTVDDLALWRAFAHSVLSADLLGSARTAHLTTVAYATGRTQYGRPVASFQAVQHLLADSLVLLEGIESAVNYASWAVDAEDPDSAIDTALVSKLYCTNAARTINEIAIQVHGGIGNTWECMIHVYLRRALLAGQVLGDEGTLMEQLVDRRLKVA